MEKKAAHPTLSVEGARNILDSLIESPRLNISDSCRDLVRDFRDRWFAFHEENLQAIEDCLPEPLDKMGDSLPAAVATLAQDYKNAKKEVQQSQDAIAIMSRKITALEESPPMAGGEAISQINAVIREWYAGGVARAMESAPARLAQIERILKSQAEATRIKNQEAEIWFPVTAFAQEYGEALGMKWGDSVAARVLEILKGYVIGITQAPPAPKVSQTALDLAIAQDPGLEQEGGEQETEEETRLSDSDTEAGYEGQGSN